jgi:S1-C subfamily serine protease
MSRIIYVCLLLIIFSCAITHTPQPSNSNPEPLKITESLKDIYDASLTIYIKDEDKNVFSIGSGVVLKCKKGEPILILTALHVIKAVSSIDGFAVIAGKYNGKTTRGITLLKQEKSIDLAIMQGEILEVEDCPTVTIADNQPFLGEDIWIIGAPANTERNITKGIIGFSYHEDGIYFYRTDAVIYYGNSGGGAFNSKGKLIGIAEGIERFKASTNDNKLYIYSFVPGGNLLIGLPTIKNFIRGIL